MAETPTSGPETPAAAQAPASPPAAKPSWQRQLLASLRRISLVLLVILGTVWFVLAQPSLARNHRSSASVDPSRLRTHVETLCRTPRDPGRFQQLNEAADYIKAEFAKTGGRVSEQTFGGERCSFRNIIVRFGPEKGPRVVVGAHYDTVEETLGADDNASGVAGLIELARLLDGKPLKQTVELVAYTLEEPPFFRSDSMGSAQHAAALRQEGVEVTGMLALEMIGRFNDAPWSQKFPMPLLYLYYPTRGNFVAVVGNLDWPQRKLIRQVRAAMRGATPLPVASTSSSILVPGVDFSDHLNFWKEGYPAAMITDTAFCRTNDYHTMADTPDKLDYSRMSMVVVATYEAVMRLANPK